MTYAQELINAGNKRGIFFGAPIVLDGDQGFAATNWFSHQWCMCWLLLVGLVSNNPTGWAVMVFDEWPGYFRALGEWLRGAREDI